MEYYFSCVSGGAGCTDSGWVSSSDYTADNLTDDSSYAWQVKARDLSGNDTELAATTDAASQTHSALTTPSNAVATDQGNGRALIT
ncbi:hypothetical protein I6N98_15935 [Spongiibacter nanhainus]|uniref:Fibronectin type-III domain-containing protein n=1 Tax=Spongiibacter nanhainus TaxID=2794344 RepID=A0A7T4UPN7_9GAMM|nr:hypothetical protein [Spongiibacter nanhainus]QQD17811.1 hypothetical protein I6N98_15935 [Spongiibacter nanhainus]